MKVTKIIREYVEEKINAKYQPLLDAVVAEYADEDKKYTKQLEETHERMEQKVREEFRKILANYYPEEALDEMCSLTNIKKSRYWVTTPYCYSYSPKFREEQNNKLSALGAKRDKAIKNVLIGLELGGTKQDLDRLLEEALAEEV
jgi:hypothetical protein